MDVLHYLNANHLMAVKGFDQSIIPMVLIPLTAVTVVLTSVASIIAGWFGVKLHTEGPKQLLEVLLKKRVLFSMIVVNLLCLGIYKSYVYVKTLPKFIYTINRHSEKESIKSTQIYAEDLFRKHEFVGELKNSNFNKLEFEKMLKLPKGAFRSAAVSGDSLFYGLDDGNVYEVDKNNLTIKRKFYVGTQVTTRPLIFQGHLYVGEGSHDTHHARVYSFDLKSGKYFASIKTKGHTEGQPTISTFKDLDLLFVIAGVDGLYAVNPKTMKPVWHKIDGHLDASVTVEGNNVYAGTGVEKGSMRDRSYAINYDFSSGKINWKKELPLSNWMHPIVTTKDVCYVLGEIYFESNVGLFYCLNKKTGVPHFAIPFNSPIASKPYYIKSGENEYAFFADFKGVACGVDLIKKEKMWCYDTGKKETEYALSSFEFDSKRNILWYPTLDNGLFGFDPLTGKKLIQWQPNLKDQGKWETNYGSVNIIGDFLYSLDIDGNLRKFKL